MSTADFSSKTVQRNMTRSTGQPMYNALADLVGLYVEVING